ncbi:WHG domain-containing protein [Nonomuraea angiospora]|uniref:TetR/AcrR family transcriptional regulator n=1 Tax=Nonomuraea angiospora TaxID=46172 RepID=UPI003330986D
MPRAGLSSEHVTQVAADLADEVGFAGLTLALLADRLGVRTPSLYKHVGGLPDLRHKVATLAMEAMADAVGMAVQGVSGKAALAAYLTALRAYVTAHPGAYSATIGEPFGEPDDPLLKAGTRMIDTMAAVLRGYGVPEEEMVHAIRTIRCTIHGFAALQVAQGFQWTGAPDVSFAWMIDFLDRGLRQRPEVRGDSADPSA